MHMQISELPGNGHSLWKDFWEGGTPHPYRQDSSAGGKDSEATWESCRQSKMMVYGTLANLTQMLGGINLTVCTPEERLSLDHAELSPTETDSLSHLH